MNRLVCDYLCIPDCGGQCIGYKTCDLNKCGCVCVQNASCPPGFRFSNQGGACGCVCDLNNLHCGVLYDARPEELPLRVQARLRRLRARQGLQPEQVRVRGRHRLAPVRFR